MKDLVATNDRHLFDAEGFFLEPDTWTVGIAKGIAQADGLGPLNSKQLELLHTLRSEYEKNGSIPAFSHVCHLSGEDPDCLQYIFPSPLMAWRVAGLPNPGEEAKAYMSKN
jgi:sulfur relay (sulfurtransferase) DsrC/TusE family protein